MVTARQRRRAGTAVPAALDEFRGVRVFDLGVHLPLQSPLARAQRVSPALTLHLAQQAMQALRAVWLHTGGTLGYGFVVDADGRLRVAPRNSMWSANVSQRADDVEAVDALDVAAAFLDPEPGVLQELCGWHSFAAHGAGEILVRTVTPHLDALAADVGADVATAADLRALLHGFGGDELARAAALKEQLGLLDRAAIERLVLSAGPSSAPIP